MVWGYLSEFWNAVSETVVGGITYTVDWFESIGNAVAGAVGALFDDLIHHFYDLLYLLLWFYDSASTIFSIIFSPLYWIFNFVKGFISSATSTVEELGLEVESFDLYTTNVNTFFDSIPHLDLYIAGVGAMLGLFFLIFIVKKSMSI